MGRLKDGTPRWVRTRGSPRRIQMVYTFPVYWMTRTKLPLAKHVLDYTKHRKRSRLGRKRRFWVLRDT